MAHRQTGRKAVLDRLRKYAGRKRLEIDAADAGKTVARETDRGAVILMGAHIEDALQEKIEESFGRLNSDEHDRIFGPDQIIGSFSAKIRIAQALQIIDRETANLCHVIREMRNACAHSRGELSFEDDLLRDALKILLKTIAANPDDPSHLEPKNCRGHMMIVVHYLLRLIDTGDKGIAASHTNTVVLEMAAAFRSQGGASPDKSK